MSQKPGKLKERKIATRWHKDQTCGWKFGNGKLCEAKLAKDSYFYCEEHKIEVRRNS